MSGRVQVPDNWLAGWCRGDCHCDGRLQSVLASHGLRGLGRHVLITEHGPAQSVQCLEAAYRLRSPTGPPSSPTESPPVAYTLAGGGFSRGRPCSSPCQMAQSRRGETESELSRLKRQRLIVETHVTVAKLCLSAAG